MRICFSQDKSQVIFAHEDATDYNALMKFPAFAKAGLGFGGYHVCPAILPVAYSIITRFIAKHKKSKVDKDIVEWMEQDFKLATLPVDFKYHTEPKQFQDIALRYMHTVGGGGLLLDPGMGKSKVCLDLIWLRQFARSLIVCPAPLLFVWEDEIQKHRPELTYHVIKTTDWEEEVKNGMLLKHVIVINYTKLSILKWRLKETSFDYIHLDEFLIKDISTNRTKDCLEVSRSIPHRSGGSGTLINNTPLDCYAPIRFLQPSLVGTSYTNFKDRYTVQQPIKFADGRVSNAMRVVNYKGVDEMKSILESCSIVMTKEEWLKLPAKTFHDTHVQMSDIQKKAYYDLARNLTMEVDDQWVTVDNPLVMMAKLYQISNGFLYLYPEDSIVEQLMEAEADLLAEYGIDKKPKRLKSDRRTYFFPDQPKVQALERVLVDKIPGRKAMIWFNMEAEYTLIEDTLKRLDISFLSIKGGEKKIGEKVRTFNRDPSIKLLVCQAKSVNYGITVMGTKRKDLEDAGIEVSPDIDTSVYTQIFFSLNFSLETYLQQQDRVHRLGQEHECEYYRLFANSPVEMKIKQAIEDKQMLRREMLVDVAHTLLENITEL